MENYQEKQVKTFNANVHKALTFFMTGNDL